MNISYAKEFDRIVEKAKSIKKPLRVALAGAGAENILAGLFEAQEAGFVEPILIGDEERITGLLEKLGLKDRKYSLHGIDSCDNVVQYAIEMVNAGKADCILRGNTQTRDFLMPILNKANHFIQEGSLVTQVDFLKVPGYERILAVSDVTLLINPTADMRQEVVKNMVKAFNAFGVEKPNIALLAMVEKPSFHMRDTVEDQTIVKNHEKRPLADCNLVGPIAYDLIISKEAARLKGYDCQYCGEFDGIVVPNLISGNLMVKVLQQNAGATGFGILVGTKYPVAVVGRSDKPEQTFLSLAGCAALALKENLL